MGRPTILIVDDEIIIARELEARLKTLGYEVAGIASSGAEAIRLVGQATPSLVLMDIVLKGNMDGVEAASEIRRRFHVPIIYVTAYTDKATLTRAKITEPFAYIVKPFSERELGANIEMALYKHWVERRLRRLERWFVAAIDEIADAVIATDQEGKITVFNPAAQAITGWSWDQAVGRKLQEVFRLVHRNGDPVPLDEARDGPVVCLSSDTQLLDKSDRKIPVNSTTSYVRDDQDQATGTVSVFRDASGEKSVALVALNSDVSLATSQALTLRGMLQLCAESVVRNLHAAFARIWTVDPTGTTLVLQASAGMYTHLDGAHSRVPIGQYKIGLIAEEKKPHLTNDVLHDPRIGDPGWARRERMVAFAGYPLLVDGRLLGVFAMFSRHHLFDGVLEALGSVCGSVAVGIERKWAEAERGRVTAMFRIQVDRMPLAYILFDAENRVLDWNPAAERMFGYTKQEMMGRNPLSQLVVPSGHDKAREVVGRLQAGDMFAHAVNENLTKDGRTITCEWLNTPLWGEDGRVSGVVSIAQDVTERRSLEDKVREAQDRLQRVVTSSPAVLYTLAGEIATSLVLTWISPNVQEMTGYPLDDVMKPTWWYERVHPDDLQQTNDQIQVELFGQGRLAQEYRFRHRDGTYRWVRSEMRGIRDASGKVVEAVGSWSDITDRKQLEQQFRQAQKMEVVGQLAGGVAHDFNNLLTAIAGYSEMLMMSKDIDETKKGMIREIGRAGERAASLTRQLLAFSRKQILEPRIVNMNALISDMEKMLQRLIGEDVALTLTLDPRLSRVKADTGQLEQVVMNLCVNARDAMPQGGKLTIETGNVELDATYAQSHPDVKPGPFVLLAVSDTGCGITPENMARIFEPFFTTKGPGKGTGLGLATVYGIVRQSGGHVAVYSEPGAGTTFKIYLPQTEQSGVSERPTTTSSGLSGGSETILLVEDEETVRVIARSVLASCGYNVLEAGSGTEALKRCERYREPIHLLVTDVVMPGMAGRELSERLASLRPAIKVLYMSGYTDDAVIRHGVLQEETPFLQKPFTPRALAAKVREVLDRDRTNNRN